MFKDVGMVAGMKGVAITEHGVMVTVGEALYSVARISYNHGLRSALVAPRRSISVSFWLLCCDRVPSKPT
jgi:hypothetical protein